MFSTRLAIGELEGEKTDLPSVIRVVQRHAVELPRNGLIGSFGDSRQLARRGVANGVDESCLILVEQCEIASPRRIAHVAWRDRPPRLADGARKGRARRSGDALDEQMPPVCEMQHEIPNRVSVRGEFARRDARRDPVQRLTHRRAVPRRTGVRFVERSQNGRAVGLDDFDGLRHPWVSVRSEVRVQRLGSNRRSMLKYV